MMNQLIKELADQCYHRYSEYHIDLEKFAQLIIQECAEVGNKVWLSDNSTVPIFPGKQIKEHFGLEP
jgi:hypothetical protein